MKFSHRLFIVLLIMSFWVLPLQAQEEGQPYIIQLNDSLWKLAEKYLGSGFAYSAIIEGTAAKAGEDSSFTLITDANQISVGQKIWIPTGGEIDSPANNEVESPAQTTSDAQVQSTSVSADGPVGHIAFSFWNPESNRCTYEVDIISVPACLGNSAQCQAERRIMTFNNISEPALSPDGSRLAFRSWGGPVGENNPYDGCASALEARYLANSTLDGAEFRGTGGFWEDSHPDWSPDGNRLIFDSSRNGDGIIRIFTISPDGENEHDLRLAGQQPSWAPDNNRFVMRACDFTGNRCGLWIADAAGNRLQPALEYDRAAHPDWSPLNEEIVYQSPENGSWDLFIINADGSGKRQLTDGEGIEGLPAWSPDGQWIAYLSNQGSGWQIEIMRADGTAQQIIFPFDGGIFAPTAVEPYGVRDWIDEQISWSK